ncbi:sensor histidine kinase [Mycobacterium sp. NPDC050041]|uniref:sensor histidine kinase n=1 Tax=Mycobacterium sp. NPDC050041 TaxID=3364293 RepID=UPI003C2CFD07
MPRQAERHLRRCLRRGAEMIPLGYTWRFVMAVDATMLGVGLVAALQRPLSDLPIAIVALLVSLTPWLCFFTFGTKHEGFALCVAWTAATGILLFATSAPVADDFAPLLLGLMVGVVGALTAMTGGFLAASAAAVLLLVASALGRVDSLPLYLSFIGIGWLVGYLMNGQSQLLIQQQQAQARLAELAAGEERRRIAREVHDVIAHSLSITLLHVTGARRGLQEDRDVDDAVEALEQAEQLGRQAMADIRRTVGLLDTATVKMAPEPGVADIYGLVEDFARAGVQVDLVADGPLDRVTAAVGLALYRITQESLANVAKHAVDARCHVALTITAHHAVLTVTNDIPVPVGAVSPGEGRGMQGMRQRVELLGGQIDAGPSGGEWSVRADIPLADGNAGRPPRHCPL